MNVFKAFCQFIIGLSIIGSLSGYSTSIKEKIGALTFINNDSLAAELQAIMDSQTVTRIADLDFGGVSASIITPEHQFDVFTGQATPIIPMDASTKLGASNVVQAFLATLTLAMEQEGTLSVDQTIGDFINLGNLNISQTTPIEQLLNHTSGIADFTADPDYEDQVLFDANKAWTPIELINNFVGPPSAADSFSYSNTNYLVLGLILEEANGPETLQETFDRLIATPAGLSGIEFFGASDPSNFGPLFSDVSGFGVPQQLCPNISKYSGASYAGNLIGTPNQFVKFADQLAKGNIVSEDNYKRLLGFMDISGRLSNRFGKGVENFLLEIDNEDVNFFGHIGKINNVSVLLFNKAAETGIFLSTNNNQAAESEVLELARRLLDVVIEETAIPITNETPLAFFTADPSFGTAPLSVNFDASNSVDIEEPISAYEWDFGDGTQGSGMLVNHTYKAGGDFTATLIVKDSEGASDTTSQIINVESLIPTIEGFDLIAADGTVLKSDLQDGDIIDPSEFPTTEFNIRAIIDPDVEVRSVEFDLRGQVARRRFDHHAPFDLFGTGAAQELRANVNILDATPYSRSRGLGVKGVRRTLRFIVVGPRIQTVTLEVETDGNGSAYVIPRREEYSIGERVNLFAIPNEGFIFDNWTDGDGNVISNTALLTATLTMNSTFRANFVEGDLFLRGNTALTDPRQALDISNLENSPVGSGDFNPNTIFVYPNPVVTKQLNLIFRGKKADLMRVQIYDVLGKSVFSKKLEKIHSGEQIQFDLNESNLGAGTYILQVQIDAEQPLYQELIIQGQ